MKNPTLKPGERAPASGQYQQVGPRGAVRREVTVVKREPMPPAPKKGMSYKLVDRTKNKAGRGD
jgi:hypothetical protein